MSTIERLLPERCAVVVIDVQERLARAMPEDALRDLLRAAKIVLGAARALGTRVFYSEQYPRGLGVTLEAVQRDLAAASAVRFEKMSFSVWETVGFAEALQASGADTVVLLGLEAHVCVCQSARDLVSHGFRVHVLADGVGSRRADHRELGLSLCARYGAIPTTAETVVFDWLRTAESKEFKEIASLVRDSNRVL